MRSGREGGCRRGRMGKLEADDAEGDGGEADELEDAEFLAEQDNADNDSADRADADPDGVGDARGKGLHGAGEKEEGCDHRGEDPEAGHELCEALGFFEARGPDHFEKTGDGDEDPGSHGRLVGVGEGVGRRRYVWVCLHSPACASRRCRIFWRRCGLRRVMR